jgi:hypothetical protein
LTTTNEPNETERFFQQAVDLLAIVDQKLARVTLALILQAGCR